MREHWIALVFGWVFIFFFLLIASFALTLTLTFSEISPNTFSWVSFILGMTGLFSGGVIAGLKGKKRGWFFGGVIGVGFTILIFLIQYLGYQKGFSLEQMLQHFAYMAVATLGGIVGVNVFQREK